MRISRTREATLVPIGSELASSLVRRVDPLRLAAADEAARSRLTGCAGSRRLSPRFPSAISAARRDATRPCRSASPTSAAPGRCSSTRPLQGRHLPAPRARRRDRHRRRHLARAARGPHVGTRRLPAAPPLGPRQPRPRGRLRGPLPAPRRPAAAAARSTTSASAGRGSRASPPGTGEQHVILIHGLGGAKSSFYETVAALTPEYTVHAIDLPGFGSSSKPLPGPLRRRFFARHVLRFMDTLAIDRAHLVGNSMGGRVSIEVGAAGPEQGPTLSLLAPAMAFKRGRELGAADAPPAPRARRDPARRCARTRSATASGACSRAPTGSTPRSATSPPTSSCAPTARAPPASPSTPRRATSTSRRPSARAGSGPGSAASSRRRCSSGARGPARPRRASRNHVAAALPHAPQVVLPDCGHVPQIELPERTHALIGEFLASAGPARRYRRGTGALGLDSPHGDLAGRRGQTERKRRGRRRPRIDAGRRMRRGGSGRGWSAVPSAAPAGASPRRLSADLATATPTTSARSCR